MSDAIRLTKWKLLLTWRLYTRNAIASLETILFFVVFILWIIGWYVALYWTADWMMGIASAPRSLVFARLFSFVLILWLLMSLAGYRLNEGYNLERLRFYPLKLRSVFWATILGAFADISILLPLVGGIAIFLGTRPFNAEIPIGLIMVLGMTFFTAAAGIALVSLLYVFLPRLNLLYVGVVILLGVAVWVVLLNLELVEYPMAAFFALFSRHGMHIFKYLPTGQIGLAIEAYLEGDWHSMWRPLLGFAAWTAGVLLINYALTAYLWLTDVASKTGGRSSGKDDIAPWFLRLVEPLLVSFAGRQAFAVYSKDMLEFAFRSPYFIFYKALPGTIAPIIILLAMHWDLEYLEKFSQLEHPEIAGTYSAIIVVLFIIVAQGNLFAGNQFGLEDVTIRNLMLMPTPRRFFLLGKNLFLGGLFLIDSIVLSFLILIYFPGIHTFFAWLSLLITMFLIIMAVGNFASALWPYWMPLDRPSFTLRSTVILGLVNAGATFALIVLFSPALAAVLVPHQLHLDWLSFLMMPLAVAYGVMIHRFTMNAAVSLLESNEFLVLRRIADREEL